MRCVLTLCLVLASGVTNADEVRAVLTRVSGAPVVYELSNGEVRHASMVAPGRSYSLPLEISTGQNDSATFVLPTSQIEVSSNSMMRIVAPEPGPTSVVQRVLQSAGSVLFRVHKGTLERFQVETPFLVSVVKGTVFNVLVREDGATVSLQEGRLQVNSVQGRQSVELRPGDVAFAGRDGVLHLLEVQLADGGFVPGGSDGRTGTVPAGLPSAAALIDDGRSASALVTSGAPHVGRAVHGVSGNVASAVGPVVDTVVAPVAAAAPVIGGAVAPVIDTVVAPIVDVVVAPIVDTVVDPLASDIVNPLVTTTVDRLVPEATVTMIDSVVAPSIDPIVTVLEPLVPDVVGDIGGQTTGDVPVGDVIGRLL